MIVASVPLVVDTIYFSDSFNLETGEVALVIGEDTSAMAVETDDDVGKQVCARANECNSSLTNGFVECVVQGCG